MRKLKRFIPFYIMMIPGLTYLFINNYIPLTGLQLAFKKFKYNEGIFNSPWVGMKNFSFLFKTNDAWVLFRNTLGYNLLFLVINTVLAIAVAILLNEVRSAFVRKMSQTVVLIPFLLSYVVISYIVYALLGQSGGMVNNSILKQLGMEPVSWYTKPKYWPLILTLVQAWKAFGYNSIIYYATIIGFDK